MYYLFTSQINGFYRLHLSQVCSYKIQEVSLFEEREENVRYYFELMFVNIIEVGKPFTFLLFVIQPLEMEIQITI